MNLMLCQAARSIPTEGWEIYEQGLYDIAQNIKENYGNIEWILTENGMGVEGGKKFRKDGVIKTTTGLTLSKTIFVSSTGLFKMVPTVKAI